MDRAAWRGRSEQPGQQVGHYKLLEQLGEGGFGTVWAAEQTEPVRRRVALKVIKLGMDTRQVVARFEQERQALALMDHPNIAKVFDAGVTEMGRPYFVMELCKGEPIVDYCDRFNLRITERLELFAQVCAAVQHAHTKGIIHRDIKPSNILVNMQDGRPSVKVIDFGIAKATASKLTEMTLFTEHRQLIGTPEYMSPEQAEGSLDIDTRTDIYSLGVLLYELLTGTTPFSSKQLRSARFAEIQRIIREVDPPKPSTRLSENTDTVTQVASRRHTEPKRLGTIVRGELDWIVMKAMEKDRQRRYETPNALAADILRYLAGEAVVAAPPSRSYRVRKVIRRNKGVVAAGAVVSASLVLGLIGTSWGLSRALREKDRADEQATLAMAAAQSEAEQRAIAVARAEEAEASRVRAEAAEAEALARAGELELVAEFQSEQLGAIEPEAMGASLRRSLLDAAPEAGRENLAAALEPINFTGVARTTLQDNIFDRTIRAIDTQFEGQPLVRASLLQTVADTLRQLGILDPALDPQSRALAIRRDKLGNDHLLTQTSTNNMGRLLADMDRLSEAEIYFREATESARRLWGEDHLNTLTGMNNVAGLLRAQGRSSEAEPYYRDALAGYRRSLGDDDPFTLNAAGNLGSLLQSMGRPNEAEPYTRQALEGRRRVLGDDHPNTLVSISAMGELLRMLGRPAESEPYLREALERSRRVLGDDHPTTLTRISDLGVLFQSQGRPADAEPYYREALDGFRRVLGEDHQFTVNSLNNLGGVLADLGRLAEAEPYTRSALEISRRVMGENHPATIAALGNMGALLRDLGRADEARACFLEAIEVSRRILGDDHPHTRIYLSSMGRLLETDGRPDEAEPYHREALEANRRVLGDDHPSTLIGINNMGSFLRNLGRLDEADALGDEAVRRGRLALGAEHWNVGVFLGQHARTLVVMGRYADAEERALESYAVLSKALGTDHARSKQAAKALADLYDARHASDPAAGHNDKAEHWRAMSEPTP